MSAAAQPAVAMTDSVLRRLARRVNVPGIATIAVLLGAWEAAVASGLVQATYIVAPTEIVSAGATLLGTGELVSTVAHTLEVVLVGWSVSVVGGIVLGCLLGSFRTVSDYSGASVDLLRSLPPVAFVPVGVLVFGFSQTMEIAVVVLGGLWIVAVNTAGGVQRVGPALGDVARTYHVSRLRTLWSITLPASTPAMLVGARLAMATSLILAVTAEMVGNPNGMGYAIVAAQQALQPAQMFAYIVLIGLLGLAMNGVLTAAARRWLPGLRTGEGRTA